METRFRPTAIKAPHGASVFEVTWADGPKMSYPHEILRGYCPCAGCQGHSGAIHFQAGGNLELREIERVGNYALSFTWGDSHSSGIYSFRYLRTLGEMLEAQGADAVKALGELPALLSERIAVISTSYPRELGDASGHFVAAEVKQLVRAGHDVSVFVPGAGPSESDGARVHWLADGGAFGWPGALSRLKEAPRRIAGAGAFAARTVTALRAAGSFDRVQSHFLLPSAWPITTLAFGRASGTRLELVGHGSDVRLFCGLPARLRGHVARAWLARAASLRVTSTELAELVRAANPELSASLHVGPSPIDVEGVPDRETARRTLGLQQSTRLALIVSRLIPGKRVALGLQALAWLDEVSVVVVGDGPELEALRSAFPRVHFTGRLARPEALTYIAAADVLVSASAEEGAPSVVREARALGVKVVAVAAGDLALWAKSDPGLLLVPE